MDKGTWECVFKIDVIVLQFEEQRGGGREDELDGIKCVDVLERKASLSFADVCAHCMCCVIVYLPLSLKEAVNNTMHACLCMFTAATGICPLCAAGVAIDLRQQT